MRKIIAALANISRSYAVSSGSLTSSSHHFRSFVPIAQHQIRTMSGGRNVNLSYQDVLDLKAKKEITLVDVREHKEIQETGKLPDSIHIPLGELQQALQISADEFKSKYDGADQPTKATDLVFSCRGGMRSQKAMAAAQEIGFTNVRHYAGGWLDWEANTKK